MKISKSKGFTLVELIIVVLIIGILAAISIVGYTNQANKARANSAYSALNDAVRAAATCLAAGDTLTAVDGSTTTPPVIVGGTTPVCTTAGTTNAAWPNLRSLTNNVLDYDSGDTVTAAGVVTISVTGTLGTNGTISCSATGCWKTGF